MATAKNVDPKSSQYLKPSIFPISLIFESGPVHANYVSWYHINSNWQSNPLLRSSNDLMKMIKFV